MKCVAQIVDWKNISNGMREKCGELLHLEKGILLWLNAYFK